MDNSELKNFLLIFLSLLFWLQVTAVIILGARWLLAQPPSQMPPEEKTPAMIRGKI